MAVTPCDFQGQARGHASAGALSSEPRRPATSNYSDTSEAAQTGHAGREKPRRTTDDNERVEFIFAFRSSCKSVFANVEREFKVL